MISKVPFRKRFMASLIHSYLIVGAVSFTVLPAFATEIDQPEGKNNKIENGAESSGDSTGKSKSAAKLSTVVVRGDKVEKDSALPKRPIKGVYGTATTVTDTPRSVAQINSEELEKDPIFSSDDLVKYAPGLTKGGGQNAGIAPTFRAQASEVFQDGQRGYSVRHPANLNAYEGADIVAGPSSVIFGSATGSGGYINYLTKKPNFAKQETRISGVIGSWIPDEKSRDGTRFTLDTTGPISEDLAYRVSVTRQRWEDYYFNVENNFDAYYGALAWTPTDNLRVDWNLSYDDYFDWNITHGWNRASQELVDDSKYWAGRATPIIRNGTTLWSPVFASGAADSAVTGWVKRAKNPQTGDYDVVANSLQALSPNTLAAQGSVVGFVYDKSLAGNELVKLSPQIAQRAEDENTSKRTHSQLRAEWTVSPDISIVNSTFVERSKDTTDAAALFQVQAEDNIIDNRTEFRWKTEYDLFGLTLSHDTNSGIIYRKEENTSLAANNSFYYNNAFDLSLDPSNKTPQSLFGITKTLNSFGGNAAWIGSNGGKNVLSDYYGYLTFAPMVPVNNNKKLYAETYASYTQDSEWTTKTIFTQHNFLFNERVGLNLGASRSFVDAEIENPLADQDPQNRLRKHGDDYKLFAAQASPYFKITDDSTIYFTIDRSLAINTGGFSSGLSWGTTNTFYPNGANELNPLSFNSLSELYEIGYKVNLNKDVFFSVAAYRQERDLSPDQYNNITRLYVKGLESALRYQPNEYFKAGLNYSHVDAYYEFTSQAGFATRGFVPNNGTAFSENNVLNALPSGRFDAVQIPKDTFSGYADYRFNSGFGVQLATWITSPWYLNIAKTVRIPTEFNIDTTFYYRQQNWSAAVQVLNITNELNFVSGLSSATNTFLQPMRGRTVQAQFDYKF
jgi:hypothetical protein